MKRRTAKWLVALGIIFFPITLLGALFYILFDETREILIDFIDDIADD